MSLEKFTPFQFAGTVEEELVVVLCKALAELRGGAICSRLGCAWRQFISTLHGLLIAGRSALRCPWSVCVWGGARNVPTSKFSNLWAPNFCIIGDDGSFFIVFFLFWVCFLFVLDVITDLSVLITFSKTFCLSGPLRVSSQARRPPGRSS